MKKFFAVFGAALLHAAFFIGGWKLLLRGYGNTCVFFISPLLSAVTFLLLGNLFYKRFRLSRVLMWFCMNIPGEILGWAGVLFLSPELLGSPSSIMVVLFTRLFMLGVVWGAVGIGWLIFLGLRKLAESRRRKTAARLTAGQASSKPAAGKKFHINKDYLKNAAMFLCFLAVLLIAYSFYFTMKERPAEAYEDEGVYTFKASSVYPTQVEISRSNKARQKTRTAYVVTYKSKGGYQWQEEAPAQSIGKQWVKEGKTVERKVFSIRDTNTYITVDPKYTPESYVAHNRSRYTIMLLVGGVYLIGYMAYQLHMREKRRLEEA